MLTEVNGVRLRVDQCGSGEPLVMVHGSWNDRHVWAGVEELLADRFRVVRYDRRGHTDSEDGAAPGTRRDDEDDLAALIETLGLAPAHVVGNSFGGSVALGLAVRRPELFRTICVHEPPLVSVALDDPFVAGMPGAVAPVAELIERGEHEAAARAFVENVAIGPGAWDGLPAELRTVLAGNAGTFLGEQRDPAWGDIDLDAAARLEMPALLTRGEEGPPAFSAITGRLNAAMECAELVTIEGASHVPHETHPHLYADVVERFVAGAVAVG